MFNMIKILSIFIYTIGIFFFDWPFIVIFLLINITAMILCRITLVTAAKYILSFLPFILLAAVFNLVLGFVLDALYITTRLILICNITQCYRRVVSTNDLCGAIENISRLFGVFKIDGRAISLMVSISLAFIPVLRRDFNQIKITLKAKGMRIHAKNFKYIVKPFFTGILSRTNEIAQAIRLKGYQ